MGYYIDWEHSGGAAAVPLSAKNPLKNARPKTAKWLLYTALTGDFGLESSAEALSMDVDDTEEALQFWHDRGVIKSSANTPDNSLGANLSRSGDVDCKLGEANFKRGETCGNSSETDFKRGETCDNGEAELKRSETHDSSGETCDNGEADLKSVKTCSNGSEAILKRGKTRDSCAEAGLKRSEAYSNIGESSETAKNSPSSTAKHDFLRPLDKHEVTETIENNPALVFLFNELQRIVPGPPTLTEQKVYIFIHEFYGIDVNNILMLVDFAASIGKYQNRSPAYIDYIAKEWHKRGVVTHKQAADDIERLREYYTFEGRIAAIFDIERQFTAKEREIINEWQNYNFHDDIYHFAFELTIEHTGAVKLAYIARILANWYAMGLHNIEEITAYNEKYLTKHGEYKAARYDKQRPKKPAPSFNLTNAADEDLEAALRGELG
jgi:DnaD/phage-associated family protein